MYTDYEAEIFFLPPRNETQVSVEASEAGISAALSDQPVSIDPPPAGTWLADNLTPTPAILAK